MTLQDEQKTFQANPLQMLCSAELVASSVDGTVRRFDARAGCLYTDDLHAPVTSIALSHDDHCVLAGCLDGFVRLLDRVSGELLAEYKGKFSVLLFAMEL